MADPQAKDLQSKLTKLRREGEERAAERLAEKLGLTYVDLSKIPVSLEAVRVIPEDKARDAKVAAIALRVRKIAVAAANPELPAVKALVRDLEAQRYEVKTFVVSPSGLEAAWRFYKFIKPTTAEITGKVSIARERIDELKARLMSLDAIKKEFAGLDFAKVSPVTMIEIMLAGAFAMRASDIHTEAGEKKAKIRFRVDGLLHDVFDDMPLHAYEALVSRIKLAIGDEVERSRRGAGRTVHDRGLRGRRSRCASR